MTYSPIARATFERLIPSGNGDTESQDPVGEGKPVDKPPRLEDTKLSVIFHGYEEVIQTLNSTYGKLQELVTHTKKMTPHTEVSPDGRKRRKISPEVSAEEMAPNPGPSGLGKLGVEEINMLIDEFNNLLRETIDIIVNQAWVVLESGEGAAKE